ncbi:MAG: NAD(P)/FAD-dependent oxidoreductase [Candidatus Velthaea sp.]
MNAGAPRVLVLGAGFAGFAVARGLEHGRGPAVATTIVDRRNYTLFTPMLPEVASGSVEPRHIAQPVRASLRRAAFVQGDVTAVDVAARTVTVQPPAGEPARTLPFDHLVVALGAVTTTHHVPGAGEHTFPLKSLDDAAALRDRVLDVLEAAATTADAAQRARLLHFVVVGGGFTGVEAAGELRAFVRAALRYYRAVPPDAVAWTVVSGTQRLLEQLPPRFGRCAERNFERRRIAVVAGDDVASVDAGGLTLKSGKRIESHTVVWAAGVRPSPAVATLDVPRTAHGAVQVDADLSVPGRAGIWAAGDCAHVPRPGGGTYPQTAQDALREGARLARNIRARMAGRSTKPARHRDAGMMASLGGRYGLADIAGRMLAGFPAWLLWRAFYLLHLPGAQRKARVSLDWAVGLPFPADIARIR